MEKLQERIEIGQYLVIDPEICHGQMTFKGTRVPTDAVLTFLGLGYTIDQLLKGWPQLTRPAIVEAIQLAAQALQAVHGYPGKHMDDVYAAYDREDEEVSAATAS